MNPTKSDEYTVGYFMSKDFSDHHLDFGVRYDSVSRNGSITEKKSMMSTKVKKIMMSTKKKNITMNMRKTRTDFL